MIKKLMGLISMKAHAVRTATEDPLQKFMFRLSVPGIPASIGFQKVSGLSEEIAVIEYHEQGYQYAHKLPGRTSVPEVVCERGEYSGDTALKDVLQNALTSANFRGTAIIEKLTRFGAVAKTYKLAECWASKWEGGDMDATSDDVYIEKMTLQFEYYI